MEDYGFLSIPSSCFIGSTIYKKLFYEAADLEGRDKALFTDTINKIRWVYCLKPDTINIPAYRDEVRDYPEIEVIEVDLNNDNRLKRIAKIIMRTIPYPMLLIFRLEGKLLFYVAHQRTSQSDGSKNTVEDFIATDWLNSDNALFARLDVREMRFTSLYTLYSDLVDAISIHNVADIVSEEKPITGSEARLLAGRLEDIEEKIASLRGRLKKESQFNRKIELNIEIKRLEKKLNELVNTHLL